MNAHPHRPHEKVFTIGKSKDQEIHRRFQYLFKANLIILTNTSTPGQYTNSSPYTVSLIGQLPQYNNIQIGRCTPANAQAMKSVNYLHLQTEQLLEACKKLLRENK